MKKTTLFLGPPGTGKTHTLLNIVEQHLDKGTAPERIAFMSFTKKAADEAATRAMQKFKLSRKSLDNFRTLHSIAFRELGYTRDKVMNNKDDKELGELLGVKLSQRQNEDLAGPPLDSIFGDGNRLRHIVNIARATNTTLEKVWRDLPSGAGIDLFSLKRFAETENAYKQDTGKIDFSDMVEQFIKHNITLDVDVVIIDEAQDLTPIQWRMANQIMRKAKYIYIAGDDDQAIYEWSGSDIQTFLHINADEINVLPHSFRMPRNIYPIADNIAHRIHDRYAKTFEPDDREGIVDTVRYLPNAGLDLSEGTWMLLARNAFFLREYTEYCEYHGHYYSTANGHAVNQKHIQAIKIWERLRKGEAVMGGELENRFLPVDSTHLVEDYTYSAYDLKLEHLPIWHDALDLIPLSKRMYYLSCLRNGENFKKEPRIYIGTIHSVKGGEADNVLLNTDMTHKTQQGYNRNPDAEHRAFYVGATRARENLYVHLPQTRQFYNLFGG